jgi:DNA polymerase III delta prime subunit
MNRGILVLLVVPVAAIFLVVAGGAKEGDAYQCPARPICEGGLIAASLLKTCYKLPLFPESARPRQSFLDTMAIERDLGNAFSKVFGQGTALEKIKDHVLWKQSHPDEPLVLHLAGDNGVGKTKTALLLSTVLSKRCADPPQCSKGDNLLEIDCSAFFRSADKMSDVDAAKFDMEAAEKIAAEAARHAASYPYGIVVLNDFSVLSSDVAAMLLPLFGRGKFSKFPDFAPSKLIVVVTTDFSTEAQTKGMTFEELQLFARKQFRKLYDAKADSFALTVPYMPITEDAAAEIVVNEMRLLQCTQRSCPEVVDVTYTDDAVLFIVERARRNMALENGRDVWKQAVMTLEQATRAPFSKFHNDKYARVKLHFSLGATGVNVSVTELKPSSSVVGQFFDFWSQGPELDTHNGENNEL